MRTMTSLGTDQLHQARENMLKAFNRVNPFQFKAQGSHSDKSCLEDIAYQANNQDQGQQGKGQAERKDYGNHNSDKPVMLTSCSGC